MKNFICLSWFLILVFFCNTVLADKQNGYFSGNIINSTGYQQNGLNAVRILYGNPNQEGLAVGPYALDNVGNSVNYGTQCLGTHCGRFVTATNLELEGSGYSTLEFANGFGMTGHGEHNWGWEVGGTFSTCSGNDCGRNAAGNFTGSSFYGANAGRDGTGNYEDGLGAFAVEGSAGSIIIPNANIHTNDVYKLHFTTANSNVVGLPADAIYTVQAGDTASNIATGLQNAIAALTITYTMPNGQDSFIDNGTKFGSSIPIFGNYGTDGILLLDFPGGTLVGWQITTTFSCTGTCGNSITVNDMLSGDYNVGVGAYALLGATLTTGNHNYAGGAFGFMSLSGASQLNTCDGDYCFQNQRVGNGNSGIGENVGSTCVTCSNVTLVDSDVNNSGATNVYAAAAKTVWQVRGKPTVFSGFSASGTTVTGVGTAVFRVIIGTTPGNIGNITMATGSQDATNGWNCQVTIENEPPTVVTKQDAHGSGRVEVTNYTVATGLATNWTVGDILLFNCAGVN